MKNHRITHRLTVDTDRPTPEPIPVHQAPDPAAVEGCMLDVVRSETVVRIVAIKALRQEATRHTCEVGAEVGW